jgi:hypothetical protein
VQRSKASSREGVACLLSKEMGPFASEAACPATHTRSTPRLWHPMQSTQIPTNVQKWKTEKGVFLFVNVFSVHKGMIQASGMSLLLLVLTVAAAVDPTNMRVNQHHSHESSGIFVRGGRRGGELQESAAATAMIPKYVHCFGHVGVSVYSGMVITARVVRVWVGLPAALSLLLTPFAQNSSNMTGLCLNMQPPLDIHNLCCSCRLASEREVDEAVKPKLPALLLQFGHPRTATTLQFQTLCAIAFMLNDPAHVECRFNSPTSRWVLPDLIPKNQVYVIKTHSLPNALQLSEKATSNQRRSWLFVTTGNCSDDTLFNKNCGFPKKIGYKNYTEKSIRYAQSFEDAAARGGAVAADYAPSFGLSKEETEALVSYISIWSILRQCCGSQMSTDYRAYLHNTTRDDVVRHDGRHSNTVVQLCRSQDLDQIEKDLTTTHPFKRSSSVTPMHTPVHAVTVRLDQLSSRDGKLTGSYCRCANKHIADEKRKHNQREVAC